MSFRNLRHLAIAGAVLLLPGWSQPVRAQQADNSRPAAVSEAERKAKILESDCWRRAIFERNEWLRTQTIFPPEEVARIKTDFQARVDRMSAVELEMVLADLQLKFQMLNTPDARDVRAWFGHYMSILSSQRREEMLKTIPDLATINSQQMQQTLSRLAQQRNSRTQRQAQTRQLRSTATNPWNQPRPASRPTSSAAYRSPFRPPSFERPFENARLSGQGSMTIGPDGQVWRTLGF
jgi:hypothetical protein